MSNAAATARAEMRIQYGGLLAILDKRDADLAFVDATIATHSRVARRGRDRRMRRTVVREFNVDAWRIRDAARIYHAAGVISDVERTALLERAAVKEGSHV